MPFKDVNMLASTLIKEYETLMTISEAVGLKMSSGRRITYRRSRVVLDRLEIVLVMNMLLHKHYCNK
jgi:hypothetical protein